MTEIKIKDLRGVGDVELTLDDSKRVFVFFGSNGVGKTKTLEALLIWFISINKSIKNADYLQPFEQNFFWENQLENIIYSENNSRKSLMDINSQEDFALCYIGAISRGELSNSKQDFYDSSKNISIMMEIIGNHDKLLSKLGKNNNINEWFLERAKSVNPYQKEEDNRKVDIDTVLNALNILDNRIEKTLKIDGDGNVFLTVEGQERELSELSSGFISVVKIIQSIISAYSAFTNATDLLSVKGVVLIDEIESHLHIEWQTKIVPTLKNLFPNTTFYIATHSPLVLSQLAEGEAYLLKRDDDGIVKSHVINSPNTRLLANVLQDTFDVDLNALKRDNMAHIDQSKAKQRLLDLLNQG